MEAAASFDSPCASSIGCSANCFSRPAAFARREADMSLLFALIIVQALLGGLDNLWHHEIKERLPTRKSAVGELQLHAAPEFLYGFLFLALAWFEWRGAWSLLLAGVLALEILIPLADFIVEDRT